MSSPPRNKTHLRAKPKSNIPPGFRAPPKPQQTPISQMSVRELKDMYYRNVDILSTPSGSSSSYIPRVTAEQAQIEARLLEIEGVDGIQRRMKNVMLNGEDDMLVDREPEQYISPTVLAKQKALAKFASPIVGEGRISGSLSFQEAMEIEQRAHAQDLERQKRNIEKRQKHGLPIDGTMMTREEKEARIWAFMNYKPTESDLEDDSDDSDEDPSTWFEDDQDDGRKGQDLVDPDVAELADVIRTDDTKFHYNTFYQPHDDGD